jgi:ubiquinone/menaquinone biosynthesis C-methylase UbiE
MSEENTAGRSFSDNKYVSGQWRTRTVFSTNPVIRYLLRYCSFKRSGVDALAIKVRSIVSRPLLVIDLGSGQGAYAHWFSGRTPATIIAIDWSREALTRIPPAKAGRGKILRICADAGNLPVKSESADALYSLDTLGHVRSIAAVLDEILRVTKPGAPLFIHSECGDYRGRWPDTMLMKRLGGDFLADYDDHQSILPFANLRSLYTRRFIIESIFSAAGLTGWLTGYPE